MTAPISFSGLASGVDTESIIKQLLDVHRQPITRLQDKTTLLNLKREAFRDVDTQALNMQNQALTLRLESTFLTRSASSSDESKVKATAAIGASKTTHRVKVLQLAQEASASSQRYLSQARLLGTNTIGINQLGGANNLNAPGSGRIRGGVALEDTTTLGDLGLSGDFSLKVDPDGAGSGAAIEITGLDASSTVSDLMQAIRDKVEGVKVQLVYDEAAGGKVLQLASQYVGIDVSLSGAVAEKAFGIGSGATVSSAGGAGLGSARAAAAVTPEDLPTGTALLVSSNGRAGSLTGSVDLAASAGGGSVLDLTLASLGVTDPGGLQIDPDASGATGNVNVRKEDGASLSASDTLGSLIQAINYSVPDVTAQIEDGPGGSRYLKIAANEGGRNLTLSQPGAADGILLKLFGISDETVTTANATSGSADFTMVQSFYHRGETAASSRRVASGVKADYRETGVSDLIDGVTISGSTAGNVFSPGMARIQINNSNSLAIEDSAQTQFYGVTGVTSAAFATGLGVDADSSGTIGLNRAVKDLNADSAFALDSGGAITAGSFKVGATTLTLTQEEIDNGITVSELLARINSAREGIMVQYEAATDRFIATANEYGSTGSVSFGSYTGAAGQSNLLKVLGLTNAPTGTTISGGAGSGSIDVNAELTQAGFSIRPTSGAFSINGIAIEVDATVDTLTDTIEKINNSAAGVTASIDPNSNRLSLVQKVDKDTTADTIQVGSNSDTSNLLQVLRLIGGSDSSGTVRNVESSKVRNSIGNARKQAEIEVDNIHYTRNTNSVNDITPALTYELMGVSDSPVTVTVSGDKEKAVDTIARFVVEYNKMIKLLNPERLNDTERKYLEPVTATERSSMTYDELTARLNKFQTYNKNETIRKDSSLQIMQNQMRTSIFTPVDITGSSIRSLADIGISTGDPGAPLTTDYQGVLVADSVDLDEIKTALADNTKLQDALDNNDLSVSRLFTQMGGSTAGAKGTRSFDENTPLANDIKIQVYDGTGTANITLPAGQRTRNDILSLISGQLQRSSMDNVKVSFDSGGHLVFNTETTSGQAYLRILDATGSSAADRLSTRFGLAGGSFTGAEASDRAGMAQKLYNVLKDSTGVQGFLSQQVSSGGTYGQGSIFDEIVGVQEQITRMEERVAQRETSLRAKFTNMEQVIARLQQQQSALQQYIGSSGTTKASSSSGA
jgi:flagellar capping protein FliD